mgnify:FL=1
MTDLLTFIEATKGTSLKIEVTSKDLLDAIIKEQNEIRIRNRELMTIILEIRKPWWKKVFR